MQKTLFFFSILLLTTMCNNSTKETTPVDEEPFVLNMDVPEWSKNANIYEVNIRQYTPEGTIQAFLPHLPRLKEMGVDILWLMPIYPIGEEERKGGMGSPYASKDYKAVNPDFGTNADFKELVSQAHAQGFKVILDWVANHSAFDNKWAKEHPEWYTQDENGKIIHPKDTDWTDVADFNYDNKKMRAAMIDALKYWVTEFDVDGYRCDVAGFVPDDFWLDAITELQGLKHLFMLAEWDEGKMHDDGFHMTYGWGFHHVMNKVAKGEMLVSAIDTFMKEDAAKYKHKDYRMNFTTNHDENSWNGTIYERMGDFADAMTVLAFTIQGMPLIYSGQEATLNKRLSFFEKDSIDWSDLSKAVFFKKLLKLKHENEAIWNGSYGGVYQPLATSQQSAIYAFSRTKGEHQVLVLLNLSKEKQTFTLSNFSESGKFMNIFTEEALDLNKESAFTLASGGYLVFQK